MTTHIVCYSGGHSSALVAVEVVRKFGRGGVMLVNHDMHVSVEDADVKRFKRQVAEYLELPITFVNYKSASMDQFDVCVAAQAFKVDDGPELCTSRLKTEPFMRFLRDNFQPSDVTIYYGFDANEPKRITRRTGILGVQGYATAYPLAFGERTIYSTNEIGIAPPLTYSQFKHGNCVGCLKAGWQHWYIVYCTRPDLWLKGKWAEEEIGYAIHHDKYGPRYLADMEADFAIMKCAGVPQTEHIPQQKFWSIAKRHIKIALDESSLLPCECTV
jgi:hypothetical protein